MKLLELEPEEQEEAGVLNTEDEAGNKPPTEEADGRPSRGWRRIAERFGSFLMGREDDESGSDLTEEIPDWDGRASNARPYTYGEGFTDSPDVGEKLEGDSAGTPGSAFPTKNSEPDRDRAAEVQNENRAAPSAVDGAEEPLVGASCARPLGKMRKWFRREREGFTDSPEEIPDWDERASNARPYGDGFDYTEQAALEEETDRDRAAKVRDDDTDGTCALAGGPAARAAQAQSDDTDGTCALAGGPAAPAAPSVEDDFEPDQDRAAQAQNENRAAPSAFAPGHTRAEWVMVGIAFLAAGVLGVTAAFCKPYFGADEDPMELPSYHLTATAPVATEPEPMATEPENPTIPPDRNPYDRFDFQYNRHNYLLLQNVESLPGVDVSAYQGNIDWKRVAASGIRFAIVRLGYRGYGSGKLVEDEYARANLEGASEAGLQVGAYFFSQALNEKEVDEEIRFLLDILGEHYLDMPVILDWEIPAADARTAGKMDARTLTDLQLHFCREMEKRGYQPMVYFNWHQSEELYLLSELEEYPFWLALYQDRMTYPWKVEMWQYSCTGRVPGIQGDVDLNVYMP